MAGFGGAKKETSYLELEASMGYIEREQRTSEIRKKKEGKTEKGRVRRDRRRKDSRGSKKRK